MKITFPKLSLAAAIKNAALALCLVSLAFALPNHEIAAFSLFYASLFHGFSLAVGFIAFAAPYAFFSLSSLLCALSQGVFLVLVTLIYRAKNRKTGMEKILFLCLAQIPFVLLFETSGYPLFPFSVLMQKVLLAALAVPLSLLFERALYLLFRRALTSRLSATELTTLLCAWLFLGVGLVNLYKPLFFFLSVLLLLLFVFTAKTASAVPFAVVLSLPLAITNATILPVAEYALCSCVLLLLCPYGKIVPSLSCALCFIAARFFEGLFTQDALTIAFTLISGCMPALTACLLPDKCYRKIENGLFFYQKRALPRAAVNRNRRAVGERLYEVSSLFRDIALAFSEEETTANPCKELAFSLRESFCKSCSEYEKCEKIEIISAMEKLLQVGENKGQVSLVDLPSDLSSSCRNLAGLLFACNRMLSSRRAVTLKRKAVNESRRLLAEQARGVAEILKELALEQSEDFCFPEGEAALSRELALQGFAGGEVFLYGEGDSLTVSVNLNRFLESKTLCAIAERALKIPLSVSEKISLSEDSYCYILRKRPKFDASFGVCFRRKKGETACGDAYSVMKIDERRFLIALSDGMGSGEKAREASDRTLSLIESFYKAKMPSEIVLNVVNKLVCRTGEEIFACLDIALVDLDEGVADVIKLGSPSGYVLSEKELRVLEGSSLPMGLLEAVHPSTMRAKLAENSFMVFVSDGVSSAFSTPADFCDYLNTLSPVNPQSLAEEILNTALKATGDTALDDMTVLAVRLTAA